MSLAQSNSKTYDTLVNSILRDHVNRPYARHKHLENWRNLPEIPSSAEINPVCNDDQEANNPELWSDYQKDPLYDPNLPKNIVNGPWQSKSEYIGAHYQILREDAIAALRSSVACVKKYPDTQETQDTSIYTKVSFTTSETKNSDIHYRSLSRGLTSAVLV